MTKLHALGLLSILALSGCGNDDLPQYYLLDRFRVIAAVASSPEVDPGTAGVTVTFHVSDPTGAGRTLSYSIVKCVDPGIGQGASPTCTGNPTATTLETGSFTAGTAANHYYGTFTTNAFTVPASGTIFVDPTSSAPKSAADQYNGVGYLVLATISASPTETVTAFKRIIVSTKTTKNQNPAFHSPALLFDGVDASTYTLTTTRFPVDASIPAASVELYQSQDSKGILSSVEEKLTITWLVSSGVMRYSRTNPGDENRFTPPTPLSTVTTFIAVLRDDRGGEVVTSLTKP